MGKQCDDTTFHSEFHHMNAGADPGFLEEVEEVEEKGERDLPDIAHSESRQWGQFGRKIGLVVGRRAPPLPPPPKNPHLKYQL